MKLKNFLAVAKDQLPLKRMFINFVITRNGWGIFHKNSHIRQDNNQPKVMYNQRETAEGAAKSMNEKYDKKFRAYKCLHCDGYHVGKTRK